MMKRREFLTGLSAVTVAASANANLDAGFGNEEGNHYQLIKNPVSISPYKKSVVEIFYYGCPHCYHLEPSLHDWLKTKPKDIHFEQMPGVLNNQNWIFMARVFYTAKELGIIKQFHTPYFKAIQEEHRQIFDIPSLSQFCEPMGIQPKDYENMFKSFRVDQLVQKARVQTQQYGVEGVPSVVVNGKYLTDVSMAQGKDNLWKLVDYLAEK